MDEIIADGGGDEPEAVMDGLSDACSKIKWRDGSHRLLFHILDSPPHGFNEYGVKSEDEEWSENGCPCGTTPYEIAKQLLSLNILYFFVRCEKNSILNMT